MLFEEEKPAETTRQSLFEVGTASASAMDWISPRMSARLRLSFVWLAHALDNGVGEAAQH